MSGISGHNSEVLHQVLPFSGVGVRLPAVYLIRKDSTFCNSHIVNCWSVKNGGRFESSKECKFRYAFLTGQPYK